MNQVTSWLQSVRVRVFITMFIVGLALFIDTGLGYGNQLQALADKPLTPEATSYQVDHTDTEKVKYKVEEGRKDLVKNSQNQVKGFADNIREKLNLDEPLPPSTKKFFNSTENAVDKTVKGTKEGLEDAAEQVTGKPAY